MITLFYTDKSKVIKVRLLISLWLELELTKETKNCDCRIQREKFQKD